MDFDVEITFDPAHAEKFGAYYTPHPVSNEDWTDEIVEEARQGNNKEVAHRILQEVKKQVDDRVMQAFYPLLTYIADSKEPRFAADVAAYATGLRIRDGWNGSTLAQMYGFSRTTVRNHVKDFCDKFGLPIPDERPDGANAAANQRNELLGNDNE